MTEALVLGCAALSRARGSRGRASIFSGVSALQLDAAGLEGLTGEGGQGALQASIASVVFWSGPAAGFEPAHVSLGGAGHASRAAILTASQR